MNIRCVWEHNGNDSLLYADNFIGAFTRGRTKEEALQKMPETFYLARQNPHKSNVPNGGSDVWQECRAGCLSIHDNIKSALGPSLLNDGNTIILKYDCLCIS